MPLPEGLKGPVWGRVTGKGIARITARLSGIELI